MLQILRYKKIKYAVMLVICVNLMYLFNKWCNKKSSSDISSVNLKYVVVHLDLKGAPPKLVYLESLLPKLKTLGVNRLLIEYEDMFPYEGRLVNLSKRNCYGKKELNTFLLKSIRLGIKVIPLVQTFGHMEYALKLPEFKHLRERPKYLDSICPSKPESIKLIKDLLHQVIKFHARIAPLKHIHIGFDEVYHINECKKCRSNHKTDIAIFINHLQTVKSIITEISPNTTVLIWDDMLRKRGVTINHIDVNNIEPVCWDYKNNLKATHTTYLYNYHKTFNNIWIASAFKGADGSTATIPNVYNRFTNNFSWLDFILNFKFKEEATVYNFKGIILTGWSRYNHLKPLCELLPTSMPSLILNLVLIKTMKKGIVHDDSANKDFDFFFEKYMLAEFNKSVKCNNIFYIDEAGCSFENSEIYYALKRYTDIESNINKEFAENLTYVKYNIKRNIKNTIININTVEHHLRWCTDILKNISDFKLDLKIYMSQFFETDAIQEYVKLKTREPENKVKNTLIALKNYSMNYRKRELLRK